MLPTPPSDSSAVEDTCSKLERLSTAMVTAMNERDFAFRSRQAREVVAHLAPGWRAEMDTQPGPPATFEEQIAAWRLRAQAHPDVFFRIVQLDSRIDERKGTASVFQSMEVTGIGEVVLHAMNEYKWKRSNEGEWLCYHVLGMRGSVGNTGGFG